MSIVVVNHVSLDGVLQGPGRPDEDTRDGFVHGGWAELGHDHDPEMQAAMGALMGDGFAWLFGRWSYEYMLGHWNVEGGPFKDGLNAIPKFVVSSDPSTELEWPNSELVTGDVPALIAELRREREGNLVIMGSGRLIRRRLAAAPAPGPPAAAARSPAQPARLLVRHPPAAHGSRSGAMSR